MIFDRFELFLTKFGTLNDQDKWILIGPPIEKTLIRFKGAYRDSFQHYYKLFSNPSCPA